jgi:tetratricopeptide (TPR) repeat protein
VADENPLPPNHAIPEHLRGAEPAGDPAVKTLDGDRYEIGDFIARGGMGSVYRAHDRVFDRPVALKVLHEQLATNPEAVRRFLDEAKVTGQLQHPSVPPVHGLGQRPDGSWFLAMKLIQGKTLAELLRARPDPSWDRTQFIQIFIQICQTIAYANEQGLIHRDLKPSNVMVGPFGEVQVMDWGLAKQFRSRSADPVAGPGGHETAPQVRPPEASAVLRTRPGQVMGTPAYMAPEQARGEIDNLDARTDVFALGGILCTILTGTPPFHGPPADELVKQAAQGMVSDALARLGACGADGELIELAGRCLAPDPAHRPADGQAVAEALSAYRSGVEARLREAQVEQAAAEVRVIEQRKKRRWQLGLAAAAGLLVLGAAGFFFYDYRQTTAREAEELRQQIAETEREHTQRGRIAGNRWEGAQRISQTETHLRNDDAAKAESSLTAAQRFLAEGGTGDLKPRLDQCALDLAMLRKLDRIDDERWGPVDGKILALEALTARWAAAFDEYGITPGVTAPGDAARLINRSHIRERLLTALEVWFIGDRFPALRALLAEVDPDEFRNAARATGYLRASRSNEMRDRERSAAPPVWFAIAHGQDESLDVDTQERLLLAAHRVKPNSYSLLMALGALGNFHNLALAPQRAGWYRAALVLRPQSSVAWNNLGNALRDSGEPAAAIGAYREAIHLAPRSAHYANLGLALTDVGDRAGAIAAFREAFRLNPNGADAPFHLGNALFESGDHAGAIAAYREALARDPESERAHFRLGNALRAQGDLKGAVEAYKRAIRIDFRFSKAHNNLGIALDDLGDRAGAIAAFQNAIQHAPQDPRPHYNLGGALRDSGDLGGASREYREAIRLAPQDPDAHDSLAWLLATAPEAMYRDGKEAVKLALRACELTRWDDPDCIETLAAAHAEAGDFGKASELQEKALTFPKYAKTDGAGARERIEAYKQKKPYRDHSLGQKPLERAPPPRPRSPDRP